MQIFLAKKYPTQYWVVLTTVGNYNYQYTYYQCTNCFTFTEFYNKYNIIAIGIDKNALPNTELLVSPYWRSFIAPFTDAYLLVTNLEQ